MSTNLNKKQFNILSSFFSDLAKGVGLATILGQGVVGSTAIEFRIIFTVLWLILSCLFLFIGLLFVKD